jgi:hypothetical protein
LISTARLAAGRIINRQARYLHTLPAQALLLFVHHFISTVKTAQARLIAGLFLISTYRLKECNNIQKNSLLMQSFLEEFDRNSDFSL